MSIPKKRLKYNSPSVVHLIPVPAGLQGSQHPARAADITRNTKNSLIIFLIIAYFTWLCNEAQVKHCLRKIFCGNMLKK